MELCIDSLSKRYGRDTWALRELSLRLEPGVLGLLGPNGAGKSTLMRIIATVSRPTSGKVSWNGVDLADDPDAVRRVLGYLPQDFGVYPNLSGVEFLEYIGAAKGVAPRALRERIGEVLQVVNLTDAARRPLGGYSGGMKQRLGIAQALLNDPELLIVDEPTVGLDPEERIRFRHLLTELAGERIIILSTHIVSDVEATATQIALINKGSLLAHEAPEELLRQVEDKVWEWTVPSSELTAARQRFVVSNTQRRADGVRANEQPTTAAARVTASLEDAYLYRLQAHRDRPA